MKTLRYDTFSTPLGEFSVALDGDGALVATAFGDESRLRERIRGAGLLQRDSKTAATVRRQIVEYFDGARRNFSLPMAPVGTSFQNRVWAALGDIPFGETRSYGEVAALLGKPGAARAVGRANATNPRCLIAPCHRVIGANGSLTGFAFGEDTKRRLLEFEREHSAR
ncbi:MAG: methylated-DNA--[protein]-cysteine S-methyltransferase [Chthoniobacteraceae bacterium]